MLQTGFGVGTQLEIDRNLVMDSMLAGRVCKACNTRWMSGLETRSQPVIRDLLTNLSQGKIRALSGEDKFTLTQWSIKTPIACNSFAGDIPISERHIQGFDCARGSSPGRCGVFAGHLPSRVFGYIQKSHDSPFVLGNHPPRDIRFGLLIDGLALLTVFADFDLGYTFEIVEGIHEPVWPGRGHEFRSADQINYGGGVEPLKAFVEALDVRYSLP